MHLLFLAFLFSTSSSAIAATPATNPTPLDPNLASTSTSATDDDVSSVFRGMGVVQKKAMQKRNRFLLSPYLSLDFSDGPYTSYSAHFNPGYAINDYFEIYLDVAPFFIANQRSIVNQVAALKLQNGQQAVITEAKPKYQFGVEVLWAPLYGKDSLGVDRIIHSDTFLKFGASQIAYDGTNGLSFRLGLGKTFFLSRSLGLRLCVDYGYSQTIVDNEKAFQGMLLTELGTVFYF
jgi:outer membrane beta-barrel protein